MHMLFVINDVPILYVVLLRTTYYHPIYIYIYIEIYLFIYLFFALKFYLLLADTSKPIMQEVKSHLLSLGILEAPETICCDGRIDGWMDGWMRTQFHMEQMNMNKTRYAPTK